jgi:high-affinity iron transporter
VVGLAVVAFAASALIPGSHRNQAPRFSVRDTARAANPKNRLPERIRTVFGASASARLYGKADALRENDGVDLHGQMTSDLTSLAPAAFRQPIARYRRFAEHWARSFTAAVTMLQATLASGDRAPARQAWNTAFFDFMRLGADYNLLPNALTAQITAVPTRLGNRRFPGLHRIELGLWTGEPLRALLPIAAALKAASIRLQRILPTVPIPTLAYTLRIHEILEDAQRDLMSGSDVPWSGAGVLGTEAGVDATRELLATVKPILEGRDNSYGQSENWLDQLQATLLSVRRAHRGWPTLGELTMTQRERIDGALAGSLAALEQVPGALETRTIDGFPSIAQKQKGSR